MLFDKRLCHAVLDAAGVPVPASPTSGPQGTAVRGGSGSAFGSVGQGGAGDAGTPADFDPANLPQGFEKFLGR